MAHKPAANQTLPTLEPERAMRAIADQLEALQKLKGRTCQEADAEETEWEHVTRSIIELAFGNPSTSLSKFHMATAAGRHNMMGISPHQQQVNFEMRIKSQEALLRSLVATLRLQLPEADIKGVYEAGDQYHFYRDLGSLIQTAAKDVLIVDAYLTRKFLTFTSAKFPTAHTYASFRTRSGTTSRQ